MVTVRVPGLSRAPGCRESRDVQVWKVLLCSAASLQLVTAPWQVSSRLRRAVPVASGVRVGLTPCFSAGGTAPVGSLTTGTSGA